MSFSKKVEIEFDFYIPIYLPPPCDPKLNEINRSLQFNRNNVYSVHTLSQGHTEIINKPSVANTSYV